MSKFRKYIERTIEAKERFKDWSTERARVAKIKAKERHEEFKERLGRTEAIEKKRANIRKLQQKHIPKGRGYGSVQQAARGFTAPPLFSFTNGDLPKKRYEEEPVFGQQKKKKGKGGYGLFDGL